MAFSPEGYPWSSNRHHRGLVSDSLVTPHGLYWALGNTPFDREAAYRRLFEDAPKVDEVRLAEALDRGHPVAEDAFLGRLEARTGKTWLKRPVGRPPKPVSK